MSQVEVSEDGPAAEGPRPDIALSWQRSRMCGVDPGADVDNDPQPDLDSADRLLHAAQPILTELAAQLSGTGLAALLADGDGRIVSRTSDGDLTRWIERAGVVVGTRLGEDQAGTNALGTPLELKRPIVINGTEHYLERFKDMSCYGQPIIHPATRRVEGVLDLTTRGGHANPLFAPLVARAVADIETRLLAGRHAAQQRLVDAFQRVPAQRNLAVAVIGGELVLANPAAMSLFDQADHQMLRDLALDLRPGGTRRIALELSSGERALVEADGIPGTDGGALFVVRTGRSPRIARTRGRSESAGDRLQRRLRAIAAAEGSVLIAGEPGTGRRTAVADLVDTADARSIDAATIALCGWGPWLGELTAQLAADPDFLVLENADHLPTEMVGMLGELLATTRTARLVVTSGPFGALVPELSGWLARCAHRVELVPLRDRRGELPELTERILTTLRPGLRITVSALGALRVAEWPGNMAELRAVLSAAARNCRDERIDIADLPESYRFSSRLARLSERDLAERRVIMAALADCGGNKVHAARQLGMSRTTLYARMRTLHIGS
ncbi:Fis family transcriptional regulator [Nocardia cyriacigeorgica]|uniref:Fis family transcriptional regulator n=1 Tax=Nocardia cyriacigeorgica TaxID=135487 RepID=A0A6P1CYA0_9NOCA|nr:helix-turn-helix domain-containing protein [Nocardia cyriacigeorgica]NEW40462.1 Fis family transcriptional regulator [Nocardia cyriacigeorgica]NEW43085.1 Fis family transcriptional regulator [Nocardia cyriacigeorgica]NEW51743.1 Fis family transcriptional regulator [Nocardia cyriacigeorgica]